MKVLRGAAAALFVIAFPLVLSASPAGASLSGPCEASGTIKNVNYNPKTQDKATIPRKGEVNWTASVPGAGNRNVEGKINVKIGPATVNVGSWGGPSGKHRNADVYKYDFPKLLAGLKVPVTGHHSEPGINCSGTIVVQLEGSKWSNPILLGSIALTIVSIVNLALSVRAKRVRA
jgi:hypothetical protein